MVSDIAGRPTSEQCMSVKKNYVGVFRKHPIGRYVDMFIDGLKTCSDTRSYIATFADKVSSLPPVPPVGSDLITNIIKMFSGEEVSFPPDQLETLTLIDFDPIGGIETILISLMRNGLLDTDGIERYKDRLMNICDVDMLMTSI